MAVSAESMFVWQDEYTGYGNWGVDHVPDWPEEEPVLELANGEKFEEWDDVRFWSPLTVTQKRAPATHHNYETKIVWTGADITVTSSDTVQPGEIWTISGDNTAVLKFEPD